METIRVEEATHGLAGWWGQRKVDGGTLSHCLGFEKEQLPLATVKTLSGREGQT